MAYLIREFISKFKKRKQKSAIINLSSITAKIEALFTGTYSSCKLFNLNISESLNKYKMLTNKIDFLTIRPGFVDTQMISNAKKRIKNLDKYCSSISDCVEGGLYNLGFLSECHGSLFHVLFCNYYELLYFFYKFYGYKK